MMVMVSPGDPVPANVGVLSPVLLSVLLLPVSVPAVRSGAAGVAGNVVSMVTVNAGLVMPLAGVVVIWCTPSVKTGDVNDQEPSVATTAVPNTVVPSLMVTVSPGVPLPVNTGVLILVLLSVLLPLSVPAVRSGTDGTDASTVSVSGPLMLPAASTWVAVSCVPFGSALDGVMVQLPSGATTTVPTEVLPFMTVTVDPGSPVPVMADPLVGAITGADGAVVSMVTASAGLGALVLPAASVTVVVI